MDRSRGNACALGCVSPDDCSPPFNLNIVKRINRAPLWIGTKHWAAIIAKRDSRKSGLTTMKEKRK